MLDTILFSQNRLSYGKVRPVLHFRERCPYKPSLKNVNEIVMSLLHLFCCKISLNTNVFKTAAKYFLVKKQDLHSNSCNSFQWYLHMAAITYHEILTCMLEKISVILLQKFQNMIIL